MTAPSLVEEVAMALEAVSMEGVKYTYLDAAEAAIAVVLRRMEERTPNIPLHPKHILPGEIWRAMLATFRKENGFE